MEESEIDNYKIKRRKNSDYRGVSTRPDGKYYARLHHNKVTYDLGKYDLPEEAASAYNSKCIELGLIDRINDL